MTNKVKPFFIRITDDMTPQIVQDAFDKCADAGAVAEECIAETNRKHSYQDSYDTYFNYFGVDDDNITVLYDNNDNYGIDAQEITLDQLDDWLGLESKAEWNGEGLPPVGVECEKVFDGKSQIVTPLYYDDHKSGMVMFYYRESGKSVSSDYDWCLVENCTFRKPETPEQKAKRELCEAIQEAYNLAPSDLDITIDQYVAKLLYQQGYRKQ